MIKRKKNIEREDINFHHAPMHTIQSLRPREGKGRGGKEKNKEREDVIEKREKRFLPLAHGRDGAEERRRRLFVAPLLSPSRENICELEVTRKRESFFLKTPRKMSKQIL